MQWLPLCFTGLLLGFALPDIGISHGKKDAKISERSTPLAPGERKTTKLRPGDPAEVERWMMEKGKT